MTRRHTPIPTLLLLAFASLAIGACSAGDSGSSASSADRKEKPTPVKASSSGGECTEPPGDSAQRWDAEPEMSVKSTDKLTAIVKTSKGTIEIRLRPDLGIHAVNNFVFLAREDFYTCIPIHRIIKGFMIQTGDPAGTGSGGPGYTIQDDPTDSNYPVGTVAMANTGSPNTGGSQFFIMQGSDVSLSPSYSVFGQVTSGQDVIDAIASVPVAGPERSTPLDDVWVKWISIKEGA